MSLEWEYYASDNVDVVTDARSPFARIIECYFSHSAFVAFYEGSTITMIFSSKREMFEQVAEAFCLEMPDLSF